MTQIQVESELQKMLKDAENAGRDFIEVSAKELNGRLPQSRYPMCHDAMYKIFDENTDKLLNGNPANTSASFCIRYKLPHKTCKTSNN